MKIYIMKNNELVKANENDLDLLTSGEKTLLKCTRNKKEIQVIVPHKYGRPVIEHQLTKWIDCPFPMNNKDKEL